MNSDDRDDPQHVLPQHVFWDVALAALLTEQYQQQGRALDLSQLHALSDRYTIRLDDLLDTLCKLTAHGEWDYLDRDGNVRPPDADMCRLLHANHRLNPVQLDRLRGRWRPAGQHSSVQ
jgi:hypothetical protein